MLKKILITNEMKFRVSHADGSRASRIRRGTDI